MNLATISKLIITFSLSLLQLISKSTSTSTYLTHFCSNATEFATNSDYHTNLNTLFKSLSSNATINPTGFDITSAGTNTSDTVYGLFLCRGDQNITACSDCVKTATTTDLPKSYCPNRKVAVIWYDECMLRYSNESLLGKMEQSPKWFLTNTQHMTGNQTAFSDLLGNTMNSLAAQTANSKTSGKKYATKVTTIDSLKTLYAMEQCTPDISASDCFLCLTIAIASLDVMMGARVLQPSCSVHYEIYPFYNGASNVSSPPLPSPSPSPGKATKITIVNNCTYTVWPGIISTINSSVKVPTGFPLLKGESKIINIQFNWAGSIWGRTLCSFDHNGNFSWETGDCGTGKIECQGRSSPNLVTVAGFRIGQIGNQCMYFISVEAGYNLPMMVTPEGVIGARCVVTGCVFNLENSICPPSLRVINKNLSMIGCRNPCDDAKQCCKTWPMCLSSDYVESSNLFGKSCPRANNNPSDMTNTIFTCQSYKTSYKVTFCPSPNMASLFSTPLQTVQEPMPPSSSSAPPFTSSPSGKKKTYVTKVVVAIAIPIVVLTLLIASCTYYVCWKAKKSLSIDIQNVLEDFTTAESLIYEFSTLQAATNYFSDDLMLGGGGFGNVYKGTLPNGQDIAVKRLSRVSNQGIESFKNEAVLIAKLQHKNLVKLLGFCLTREEKLLVYEYVPNKSLNYFLFDPKKQGELDWPMRYNIITGIARGLLYLHEDSQPRIVHRDLKAANILLEKDMNPKIADFGLARIFKAEQTEDDTNIVAGT
ncbi:cysteine-rich receptor-like protein kinase 25 isoform X2 [Chenopodium quinoa]|nr:cysteine-rich receptor-like protein kinase 25 isoform X2 [Chenopodium quinoa]